MIFRRDADMHSAY